jgi:hypothetical protein
MVVFWKIWSRAAPDVLLLPKKRLFDAPDVPLLAEKRLFDASGNDVRVQKINKPAFKPDPSRSRPKAQRAFVMQPRSADPAKRESALLGTAPPRSPLDLEPQRGSVTRTSLRHRITRDGTAWRPGNVMGTAWPANPKGALAKADTRAQHDETALRFRRVTAALPP